MVRFGISGSRTKTTPHLVGNSKTEAVVKSVAQVSPLESRLIIKMQMQDSCGVSETRITPY